MIPISKKDLEELLISDLPAALEYLRSAFPEHTEMHTNVIALLGSYADTKNEAGLSADELGRRIIKIRQGALHLVKQIPDQAPAAPAADPLADWPLPDMGYPEAPYLGFHRFEERHARVFFGRKPDIRLILDRLMGHPDKILLLYGASGAGKSSLIEAGLAPRLRARGWAVEICRRDRDRGLLADMAAGYEALAGRAEVVKLLLLDQAEEMYTNPSPNLPHEKKDWAFDLAEWRRRHPEVRLVLSFRKEYYADFKKLVQDLAEQPFETVYLEPLSHEGAREAIAGDAALTAHFGCGIPADLVDLMAAHICPPGAETPGTAPLLQMTLRKMWDRACGGGSRMQRPFDSELFREVGRQNLPDMLNEQLKDLELHFSPDPEAPAPTIGKQPDAALFEAVRNGLALDVLSQFVTEERTARSRSLEQLETRAYAHVPGFRQLIKALKDLYLLSEETEREHDKTRLTHDTLARLVRERCDNPEKAAQLAWGLVQAKKNHPAPVDGSEDFSEADLAIIERGRPFMQAIDAALDRRIADSAEQLARRKQVLLDKNTRMFEAVATDALSKLARCEHREALEPLVSAIRDGEVPVAYKKERLAHAILEAAYFFRQAGMHPAALEAAELLPYCAEDPAPLRVALERAAGDPARLDAVLQLADADFVRVDLPRRYYPHPIDVPGGVFTMGWVDGRDGEGNDDEKSAHKVQMRDFRMAETAVTFYQFSLYCAAAGRNLAAYRPYWGIQGEHPAVSINWYDAVEYANWLSEQKGLKPCYRIHKDKKDEHNKNDEDYVKWLVERLPKANGYRLPTEAEWEYAARGAEKGAQDGFLYAGGNDLDALGWYWKNSGRERPEDPWEQEKVRVLHCRTHGVKEQMAPNQLGLYGMSGNVWEWCQDWFDAGYYQECADKDPVRNPEGPEAGGYRVLRGGSWGDTAQICRTAYRNRNTPDNRYGYVGFRLVLSSQ